ncbi:Enolase [Fusarium albosuccineum]|uniref:Enolase n=1 Tax=Fusarium albosuccineum TaxID=1237068 RepID=A0A8H4PAU4_9HYPO|nr:Enolase [Fusarium albosuccineum]
MPRRRKTALPASDYIPGLSSPPRQQRKQSNVPTPPSSTPSQQQEQSDVAEPSSSTSSQQQEQSNVPTPPSSTPSQQQEQSNVAEPSSSTSSQNENKPDVAKPSAPSNVITTLSVRTLSSQPDSPSPKAQCYVGAIGQSKAVGKSPRVPEEQKQPVKMDKYLPVNSWRMADDSVHPCVPPGLTEAHRRMGTAYRGPHSDAPSGVATDFHYRYPPDRAPLETLEDVAQEVQPTRWDEELNGMDVLRERWNRTFRALVPSGASTGEHEAVELRDKDDSRYGDKGVIQAVHNVEKVIGPALVSKGFDPRSQLKEIDAFMKELDGTSDKSRLGARAILCIGMACARAVEGQGELRSRVALFVMCADTILPPIHLSDANETRSIPTSGYASCAVC